MTDTPNLTANRFYDGKHLVSDAQNVVASVARLLDEVGMTKLSKRLGCAALNMSEGEHIMQEAYMGLLDESVTYSRDMVGGLLALTLNGNLHPTVTSAEKRADFAVSSPFRDDLDEAYADRAFQEDLDRISDRAEEDYDQRRAKAAEDRETDRLFDEDLAEDRERHTFRPGDDFFSKWNALFERTPVDPRANHFEKLEDGWKCAVKDANKNYGTIRGFPTRVALGIYLSDNAIAVTADD